MKNIYGNKPDIFSECSTEIQQLRFIVNAFTRMRYYNDGHLDFSNKGFPNLKAHSKLSPWFAVERKVDTSTRIIFGHWSSLGLYHHDNVICLDTGCVWGNELTLYNVDDDCFVQQKAID